MKLTVVVTIDADDGPPAVAHEVLTLGRGALAPDSPGLQMDETKDLLAAIQDRMVNEQVKPAIAPGLPGLRVATPSQGRPRHRGAQPVLRQHVIAPIVAGVRSPRLGRKPAHWTAVDRDYESLRVGMQALFADLAITTEDAHTTAEAAY
jgi:hypothetical protein